MIYCLTQTQDFRITVLQYVLDKRVNQPCNINTKSSTTFYLNLQKYTDQNKPDLKVKLLVSSKISEVFQVSSKWDSVCLCAYWLSGDYWPMASPTIHDQSQVLPKRGGAAQGSEQRPPALSPQARFSAPTQGNNSYISYYYFILL